MRIEAIEKIEKKYYGFAEWLCAPQMHYAMHLFARAARLCVLNFVSSLVFFFRLEKSTFDDFLQRCEQQQQKSYENKFGTVSNEEDRMGSAVDFM